MLTSVRGSCRIELCVAFARAGANAWPSRASFVASAIAVGKTRPTAPASCSGSSTTSLSRDSTSISCPTSKVRSCWSRGSTAGTSLGSALDWGSTLRASWARSPASALRSIPARSAPSRSIPASPENGRTSRSSVADAEVVTAVRRSGRRPTAHRLGDALAAALWSDVLVQAPGDLDEQPGEQVPIGFDIAQLGEHFLERVLDILGLALDFLAQRLQLLSQVVGLVAFEAAQLLRRRAQTLFDRVIMFALVPLDLLVGIGAQVFLFAKLGGERLHLLLRARFEGTEVARALRLDFPEALEKPLLEHREAAVVILHLIAKKQIADLVHAHRFAAWKWTVANLPGRFGLDRPNLPRFRNFHHQPPLD